MKNVSKRVIFLTEKWQTRVLERAIHDHSTSDDFQGVADLLALDPTKNHEYLDWVCRTYVNQSFLFEDKERILNTLTVFNCYKRHLSKEKRDIGRFASEQDLWENIEHLTPKNGEEDASTGKDLKRQEKAKAISESDIAESAYLNGWIVASPKSHFASKWWAKGTRWCTGMKGSYHFDYYHSKGPLRIFIDPEGRKFQAHIATSTFCDASDRMINANEFLDAIPSPALELLREDVVNAADHISLFTLPKQLLTTDLIRQARDKAKDDIIVLGEVDDFSLVFHPSRISMWAYNLIDFEKVRTHEVKEDIFLLKKGDVVNRYSRGQDFFECLLKIKDEKFLKTCASNLVDLWGKPSNFSSDFINLVISSFGREYFELPVWEKLVTQASKKRNTSLMLREFIDDSIITDEMADALALRNLDTLLPSGKITPERVAAFVTKTPAFITTLDELELMHMVSDETLVTVARWKNGKGLSLIPSNRINSDLLNEVVNETPNAIHHIDERFLTDQLVDKALDKNPAILLSLPTHLRSASRTLKAVSGHENVYIQLTRGERTKEITEVALRLWPGTFIHANIPLTYQQFKDGVKALPSALSRVPLVYRTIELCETALLSHTPCAVSHVPPRVLEALKPKMEHLNSKEWHRPLSGRYASEDRIHSFFPDANTTLPESLLALVNKGKKTPICTDPDNILVEVSQPVALLAPQ